MKIPAGFGGAFSCRFSCYFHITVVKGNIGEDRYGFSRYCFRGDKKKIFNRLNLHEYGYLFYNTTRNRKMSICPLEAVPSG